MMKTAALTLAALLATTVQAALYPTKPAATTWYTLSAKERTLDLRWRDTAEEPRAATLGTVRAQLLSGDEVVAYLWPAVDAAAGHASVHVPRDVALTSGSEYYVRFVPVHRSAFHAVYSADFTIVNTTLPPVAPSALAAARAAFSGHTSAESTANGTTMTVLPSKTANATATGTKTQSTGTGTAAAATQDALGMAVNSARAARMGGVASLKSKAMFVIWPVLIGIALAI